jgi:hypothetical protein
MLQWTECNSGKIIGFVAHMVESDISILLLASMVVPPATVRSFSALVCVRLKTWWEVDSCDWRDFNAGGHLGLGGHT